MNLENKDPRVLEQEMNIRVPTYPYKSSSEYAAAVNQWLWQCYNNQCMTITFPYLLTQTACRAQVANGTTDFNRNFPNAFFPNQNLFVSQPRRSDAFQGSNSALPGQSQGTYPILHICKGKLSKTELCACE